jgi:hypothetical protein
VFEHFDGQNDLIWMNHKLTYSTCERPVCQPSVVDGKGDNELVNKAVIRRNTGHKPSAEHPWKKMSVSLSAPEQNGDNKVAMKIKKRTFLLCKKADISIWR